MKRVKGFILVLVLLAVLWLPSALAGAADVVKFTDPVLETLVRKQMGKMEGDITVADAEAVTELSLNRIAEGDPAIRDISGLAAFKNLFKLSLCDNEITDVSALEGMEGLKLLDLGGNQVRDLSPLSKLPLEFLALWDNGVTDISALAPIETLNNLMLNVNQITDFSPLQNLKNLQVLYVSGNATLDYSALQPIFGQLKERDFEILTTPFDPAEVIQFGDAVLERKVREALQKPEGDVTAGDAAMLEWLNADSDPNAPDSERIHDISALRYFVNLSGLMLNGNAISDISALEGLTKLQTLWLLSSPLNDVGQLAGFTKMTRLGFDARMQDVSFIGNMPDLEELRIDGLRELPADLPGLPHLNIFCSLGGEISDISLLAQCPLLTVVDLSWNLVSDVSPLKDLPLTDLYLAGNPVADYSPLKTIYPNLVGRDFEVYDLAMPENPDAAIAFSDPVLEQRIREAIGKPGGTVTAGDAAQVTELRLGNEWQEQIPADIQITNLEGIESFINLRKLDLSFHAIHEIGAISTLTGLRELNLGGCGVTDITPLEGLVNLESLTLFGNPISDIRPLTGLTNLRSLHLGGVQLPDIGLLAGLIKLGSLYMGGCGIEDISPLAGMTNMYSLELSDNRISDLRPLSGMTNLHILRLNNNPIPDYSPIAELYTRLEEKDFELGQSNAALIPLKPEDPDAVVEIGDAALELLLREATGVADRPLTQKDLCSIGKFFWQADSPDRLVFDISALKYCLNLEGAQFIGAGISDLSPLSGLTKLRVLVIDNAMVSDLTPLAGITTLQYLELANNHISDLSPLAALSQLSGLDVSGNEISDFSPLYGLQNLNKLKINYNPAKDVSGLADIAGRLKEKDFDPGQPLEKKPDWDGGNGGDDRSDWLQPENPDAVVEFNDPVFESRVRELMGIPEGKITARDAAAVDRLDFNMQWQENIPDDTRIHNLKGIEYFINLKELNLNFHAVSDIGMLPALTRLENLDFGSNGYGDLSIFASMPKLRRLVLFGNEISDVSPLAGLTQLNYLQIEHNQIADISALAGMPELKTLDVQDNRIADFSPLYGLTNLETLRINFNATRDASGLRDIAGRLQEKDFDPDQPLEPGSAGFTDRLQPKNPDKVIAFGDKVFERRVREAMNVPDGDITAGMAAQVDTLDLGNEWQETFPKGSQFSDISGIQYFINLSSLNIAWNKVEDIGRLSKLTHLEYLHAFGNRITDLTPLATLTNLVNLNLGGNKISKIGTLAKLVNLKELYLDGNPIKNYAPLKDIYPQLEQADFKLE